MVEQQPQLTEDLEYASKVTDDLVVMGSRDEEALAKALAEKGAKKVIGTHSDTFHCDEVLATTMLLYTDAYADSIIVRTRDENVLGTLDIICDVGGVYDAATHRYDHHQSTFEETWTNTDADVTKLSSAGLIYRHFGKEVIANACQANWGVTVEGTRLDTVYERVYKKLILEVDAVDNGVSESADEHARYRKHSHLASRVARLNPEWNAPKTKSQHNQFKKAMKVAEEELMWTLRGIVLVHLPAYSIVRSCYDAMVDFHECGEIMFMDRFAPWKDFTFEIEEELGQEGRVKFMIIQDPSGMWRVNAMSAARGSFDLRVPLAKAWRGLRDAELSAAAGLPDCTFVHRAGFTGGAKSKESAITMALKSIQEFNEIKAATEAAAAD